MRQRLVGRDLSRQWEIERRDAKRAEARLSLHLLRLEESWLCRMNTVAWEQRQLQKELERLRQGNSKKKFSSFGNVLHGTQKKPEILMNPLQRGQRHRPAKPGGIKTEPHLLQTKKYETSKSIKISSSHSIDCIKNKEEAFSQSPRASSSLEGVPKSPRRSSVTVINPDQDRDSINQPQGISTDLQRPGAFSKAEVSGAPPGESEAREIMIASPRGSVDPKPGSHTEKQRDISGREMPPFDPKTYTLYNYLRTVDTMPTYLELFAKVKNARYLRHRVRPEFERVLSIEEIFGHESCLPPREGNESDESLSI
ncbi:coiled-coil domain-containing protein 190 isoform X2 [Macrotis lagotis]|uniref:coiled-coil domain-containing protein 190 isoform X2 n=1 Tax=Macrotis lagotis TaxID=92651 RepID=UPI003D6867A7